MAEKHREAKDLGLLNPQAGPWDTNSMYILYTQV